MEKTFNITLDIAKPIDPANALNFFRGDSVVFNFTYQNNGEAFDTASATKLRVYAKAIGANGIVTAEETPLFAAEVTTINTVSFSSSNTAGDAGNYLMAVILLDANDNVITAQAIFLNLIENGYAGIYQPGVDFRDQILDALSQAQTAATQAQAAATQAQTSETNAAGSATQAQESATQAQESAQAAQASQTAAAQSESNAQASATAAAGSATQAQASASNAQEAQTAAETAAQIAQATDAGKLALSKLSAGTLYFNGGTATNSTFAPLVPFSAVATVVFTGGASKILTIGNAILSVGTDGKLTLTDGTHSATSTTTITQGVTVALTMIVKGTTALVYAGTTQVLSVTSFAWSGSGITVGESGNTIIASRIAVFNFDLSASGVLYSVSDYANGKEIPPMMFSQQQYFDSSSNWAAWKPSDYSIDKSNGIKVTITKAFSSSYALVRITGLPAFMAGTIAQVSYESLEQTVSSDYAMTPDFCFVGTQGQSDKTPLTESGTTYIAKAKYDSTEIRLTLQFPALLDFTEGTYIQLNGLKVIINGVLIKLGDYTIKRNATTRLIKDESGHGLDATVNAGVYGTKDAAIATFVDEIKTQINQSNG